MNTEDLHLFSLESLDLVSLLCRTLYRHTMQTILKFVWTVIQTSFRTSKTLKNTVQVLLQVMEGCIWTHLELMTMTVGNELLKFQNQSTPPSSTLSGIPTDV